VMSRNHPADGPCRERFNGLLGNTTYYVRVRATDWVGNDSAWDYGDGAAYNFTSAADAVAPAQVAGLVAAASRTLIGVNWTANTEADLKHYEIQRAPDVDGAPGDWATIALARLNFYIDQDFTDGEISAEDTFWYRVRAVDTSDNEGDWSAETSTALSQIASDHLAALSVTTAKLAAGAVTAEKITVGQLSAITADLGTITAGTVTGATIRTADAGARVVLDSTDGLQCYNAAAALCAQIDVDGSGQIGASGGDVPPLTWNALGQFNRIQANQLMIGQSLFNLADGLLLLGSHCYITPTEWRSLRKQSATLSGAFHQTQGRWLGTRGLVVEVATTNIVENPSFEVNVTDFWTAVNNGTAAQVTTDSVYGDACAKITATAANPFIYKASIVVNPVQDVEYTASAWVKGSPDTIGKNVCVTLQETGGASGGAESNGTGVLTGQWQRIEVTRKIAEADRTALTVWVQFYILNTQYAYLDAVQVEEKAFATTYCDGDQGYGYAWTGTAHLSTSTRADTEVNLDSHAALVSNRDTFSVRVVAQASYASGDMPTAFLWTARGADDNNYIYLAYAGGVFYFYVNGANRIIDAETFAQGDWLDMVITLDFSNDVYTLYRDGELLGTNTTALTAPVLTQMNLGAIYTGTTRWNGPIAELAMFDKVLTSVEVAQLYNLQRPLVDSGGLETPGIYIVDGRFKIASSTTGNRIEITADELAGYDSAGTKQFYLQASDGKAVAGAGDVWLDASGITLAEGNTSVNKVKWVATDGDELGTITLHESGVTSIFYITGLAPDVGDNSIISLTANEQAGGTTQLQVISPSVAGYDAAGTIIGRIGGSGILQIKSHGIKTIGDIRLTDGKAAPATEAGYAILYVDSADGDLKVKFGNGFVRTIAADS